jgi:diaminopimelate decarboxylase
LLRWWLQTGRGIEVVSEFELRAALAEGFTPDRILVNGPAKHHWLPRLPLQGLSVNFDSQSELKPLLPIARKLKWRVGVRVCTRQETDPENPGLPTQFGFLPDEAVRVCRALKRQRTPPQIVHFHLRTNVPSPECYGRAIREVAEVCNAAGVSPAFLDVGGGVPPSHTLSREGVPFDADWRRVRGSRREKGQGGAGLAPGRFVGVEGCARLGGILADAAKLFPGLREVWLENGRMISAGSGVLVVQVLDVKERGGARQLICDGGRTMNALVSTWEEHELLPLPDRGGRSVPTPVFGPTCMAFDQLACRSMPRSLRPGDHLIWFEAGAYHVPWETRFSHGHAAVAWHDERGLRLVRKHQEFHQWWRQWH